MISIFHHVIELIGNGMHCDRYTSDSCFCMYAAEALIS